MMTGAERAPLDLRPMLVATPAGTEPQSSPTRWVGVVTAVAELAGTGVEAANISFEFRSVSESGQDRDLWGGVTIGHLLALDTPRVDRRFLSADADLAMVAWLMAGLSRDSALAVTLVAEPRGWQSMKLTRRETEVPMIVKRWQRLGFGPYLSAYSCQPETVGRVAHDYKPPPELAMCGARFDWPQRSVTALHREPPRAGDPSPVLERP